MKTLRVCGWAVIFTVTLLLVATPSHATQVTATSSPGSDATMNQPTEQMFKQEDNAIFVSQDWLDERERAVEQRERELDRREKAIGAFIYEDNPTFASHLLAAHERALEQRALALDRRENSLAINRAWQREREMFLNRRTDNLERRENSLAINQAWIKERQARLAQNVHDLTRKEESMAFHQTWIKDSSPGSIKLAGADSTPARFEEDRQLASIVTTEESGVYRSKGDQGRCYASVYVPAQYRTVAVTKPIEVPKGESLPRLYTTVTEQVKVSDERTVMEEILCEDRMTSCRVMEVQRSLHRGGYNPGPIDGVLGRQTMAAVNTFQKDFNLTVASYLTLETVRTLDANF